MYENIKTTNITISIRHKHGGFWLAKPPPPKKKISNTICAYEYYELIIWIACKFKILYNVGTQVHYFVRPILNIYKL